MSATEGSLLSAAEHLRRETTAKEAAGLWTPSQQRQATRELTHLLYLSKLSVESRAAPVRLSVVAVAAAGPGLAPPGADVVVMPALPARRLRGVLKAARDYAAQRSCPLAVALDLAGPELRTGAVYSGPEVELEPGAEVRLTEESRCACGDDRTSRRSIARLVSRGDRVLIDDGLISLIVIEVGYNFVLCRVELGGVLCPDRPVTLPSAAPESGLSDEDHMALCTASRFGVHLVLASRVHSPKDVQEVREALLPAKASRVFVFSKIEDQQGVERASEIAVASDGVVVSRGALGHELTAAASLVAQKAVVAACRLAGVPVLVAARSSDAPAVAQAADVANAVLDGADGLLLTGDACGARLAQVSDACREAESASWDRQTSAELWELLPPPTSLPAAQAAGAWELSRLCCAAAQVVVTASGRSARLASRCRPRWPVVVVTRNASTAARCLCWFALLPLHYRAPPQPTWPREVEARVKAAVRLLRSREMARAQDRVVVLYPSQPTITFCDSLRLICVQEAWPDQ